MVPKLLTTAVGVGSAAARISNDSVRSSALDDQSGLYVGLNGPASVIAGAIAQPALTRKSCAPNAAAWAGDAYVLTSTFAEAAVAQDTWSFLTLDDLLHHFLVRCHRRDPSCSANGFETPTPSAQHSQPKAPATIHSARRCHPGAAEETGTDEATKTTEGGHDLCLT
jgi:hypothetical protein